MKRRMGVALLALACLSALDASPLRGQNGVVFGFQFGYKEMGGDLGDVLNGGVIGEYDFSYQAGAFRYGLAFNLVSIDVAGFDESVSQVGANLYATWLIKRDSRVMPYAQLRLGGVRYRPEGDTFAPADTLPADGEEEGENAANAVNGVEGGLLVGAEFAITNHFAIDLSGGFSLIRTEEIDLSALGLETVDRGTAWSVRLGVRWNP